MTPQELQQLLRFVEKDNQSIDFLKSDANKAFTALRYAYERKVNELAVRAAAENFSLRRKVERMETKEQKLVEEGVFGETGYDSVDVAWCLLYCLKSKQAFKLTKSKFLGILYEAYASWLGSKKQRLFAEHPVCGEYGPMFWRVFKHVDVNANPDYRMFENIARQDAGVAKFIQNVANKYYDWAEKDIVGPVLKSLPYRNAMPERNRGKWNGELTDADIYAWKNPVK